MFTVGSDHQGIVPLSEEGIVIFCFLRISIEYGLTLEDVTVKKSGGLYDTVEEEDRNKNTQVLHDLLILIDKYSCQRCMAVLVTSLQKNFREFYHPGQNSFSIPALIRLALQYELNLIVTACLRSATCWTGYDHLVFAADFDPSSWSPHHTKSIVPQDLERYRAKYDESVLKRKEKAEREISYRAKEENYKRLTASVRFRSQCYHTDLVNSY